MPLIGGGNKLLGFGMAGSGCGMRCRFVGVVVGVVVVVVLLLLFLLFLLLFVGGCGRMTASQWTGQMREKTLERTAELRQCNVQRQR